MNISLATKQPFAEPKEAGSIAALLTEHELLAPSDPALADAFLAQWRSNVQPVHERAERSRKFRTVYIVAGVFAAVALNAAALFVTFLLAPDLAHGRALELATAQRWFLWGAAIGLVELTLWFIVLDTDVMRQKRERLAARLALALRFQPELTAIESFSAKVRRVESFYWSVGVGLTWTNVVLQLIAYFFFLAGTRAIVELTASAAAQ